MPGVRIAFHSDHLNERGSDAALYDYAHFAEMLLGVRAIVVVPMGAEKPAIGRFSARFPVYQYGTTADLDALCRHERIDLFYAIKYGHDDGRLPTSCRTAVHCAFDMSQPHGDVYAGVSEWLVEQYGGRFPWVPHVTWLPEVVGDLRAELGIPRDALVFGRHGGRDQFNLPFAQRVVERAVAARDDLWFVFLNTDPFCPPHPRVVHLPCTLDAERKARFVATCDAMLHARVQGETFGLAVGEFSLRNKPVLTWTYGKDRGHLRILKDQCLTYSDEAEFYDLVIRFERFGGPELTWNAYAEQFSPPTVMRAFARVFRDGAQRSAVSFVAPRRTRTHADRPAGLPGRSAPRTIFPNDGDPTAETRGIVPAPAPDRGR